MKILDKAVIGLLCLMIISIYYSLFLLSISSIGFAALALYKLITEKPSINKKDLLPFAALILIFMVTFVSGINSEDLTVWIRQMRLKLPFLLMPIAFYLLRKPVARHFDFLSLFFLGVALVSTFPVMLQFTKMESMVAIIEKGQSLNTPVDHIKYSMYLAFSIIIAIVFLVEKRSTFKYKRSVLLVGGLYLFIFLHLLAVRSGLAVFYGVSFILLLRYAILLKKPILLFLALVFVAFPFIAFKTVPTFKKKIEYMIYDYQMYKSGKGKDLSDSERMYSYEIGYEIFKESPVLGSGIGDLKKLCVEKFKAKYNLSVKKYPHNQYLFVLAGSGLVGLLLFLVGMCYPIFYFRKKQDSLFLSIWLIFIISFLVENSIERSYSISFFLLFFLGSMCKMSEDNQKQLT